MREELGISEREYKKLLKKVGLDKIYNYRIKYGPGYISLFYYIDERGSFMRRKYFQDYIAKSIYDSLDASRQLSVLQYIEDKNENFK